MNNSKSMNKLHTGSVLTALVVAGALCISTVFMDLAWAKPNSFLRPSLAKEDWVVKALEGKLQEEKQPGTPATLLTYMHKEEIFSDNSKKAKEMAGKRGGKDSLGTIYNELKVLWAVGLVEKVRDGGGSAYYLSEWLRDMKIEDVIRENPGLKFANPNKKQIEKAKIDYRIMTEINNGKTLGEIKDKLKMSYSAVKGHSWRIIAKLEGKKNWTFKEVVSNTKQVRENMKNGIKDLEEISAGFSFLVNKPVEQVAKELKLFWENMQNRQYPNIDKSLVKAREIVDAYKSFINSIERFKEAEKVKKECMIRIEALKDEFKIVANSHKFPASKTLILYSEPLLKNCGVIDLKESLDILLRNNVLDKVVLYAANPAYNHILKGLIKKSAPELKITKKTKEELGLKSHVSEVEEIEILIGKEKNILGVIKGTVETQNRGQLKDLSRNRNIPIVVFKEADGRNVYSLAAAFKSVITTQRMLIDLPAVAAGDIEKEYKEYRDYLHILSGA